MLKDYPCTVLTRLLIEVYIFDLTTTLEVIHLLQMRTLMYGGAEGFLANQWQKWLCDLVPGLPCRALSIALFFYFEIS